MGVQEKEVGGSEGVLKKEEGKKGNLRGTSSCNLWVETINGGKQEPRVETWTREANKPYGGRAAFGFHVPSWAHEHGACGDNSASITGWVVYHSTKETRSNTHQRKWQWLMETYS